MKATFSWQYAPYDDVHRLIDEHSKWFNKWFLISFRNAIKIKTKKQKKFCAHIFIWEKLNEIVISPSPRQTRLSINDANVDLKRMLPLPIEFYYKKNNVNIYIDANAL